MKTPFNLPPEDIASFPNVAGFPIPPPTPELVQNVTAHLVDYLAEHPEEIPAYANSLKIPPYAPTEEKKPATPAISETRRNAARARWDRPREKSLRVTVTIPPAVAQKLQAAATASKKPVSRLVAKCIETALPALLLDTLAGDAK